ncbi:Lysosome membrane protein 2 [Sarcoptes scabiei]|nr:Lysosome membrane protein 2 [Sarcoptes scabiei]
MPFLSDHNFLKSLGEGFYQNEERNLISVSNQQDFSAPISKSANKRIRSAFFLPQMMMMIIWMMVAITIINIDSYACEDNVDDYQETLSTLVPKFLSTGGNVVAKENSELRLECEIKDLGEHAFMWKFNNKFLFVGNLTIQPIKGIRKDADSNAIIIEKLSEELTGVYGCEISSNPPKSIHYDVLIPTAPVIIAKPSTSPIVIKTDQPLRLICNVKNPPLPFEVKWIRNGQEIAKNSTDFEIKSIKPSDGGEWFCEAKNDIGTRKFKFEVVVESVPIISVKEDLIHGSLGDQAKVECNVQAYPKASIDWFFSNNSQIQISAKYKIINLNDSSILTINKIDKKDHDHYYCQAKNDHGTKTAYFEITGRPAKPKFVSPQISTGESYSLEWVVFSQTKILSYDLKIREIENENVDRPNEWISIHIEPEKTIGPNHRQTHLFEKLAEFKRYEVELEVGNEFGKTKSDKFVFSTTGLFILIFLSLIDLIIDF